MNLSLCVEGDTISFRAKTFAFRNEITEIARCTRNRTCTYHSYSEFPNSKWAARLRRGKAIVYYYTGCVLHIIITILTAATATSALSNERPLIYML